MNYLIPDICVLIAGLIPQATVAYAKMLAGNRFDNATPRNPDAYSGKAKRVYDAHLNGLESFPLFAAAIVIAQLRLVPEHQVTLLAVGFIVARIVYVFMYAQDRPSLRSSVFGIGFLMILALFVLAFLR